MTDHQEANRLQSGFIVAMMALLRIDVGYTSDEIRAYIRPMTAMYLVGIVYCCRQNRNKHLLSLPSYVGIFAAAIGYMKYKGFKLESLSTTNVEEYKEDNGND